MELNIGSNIIRNASGVLNVEGKDQIIMEIRKDVQLLLTMDIYDSKGAHIAKLRRNTWTFNNNDRYNVTTDPKSLKLIDKITDESIVEVNVVSRNEIQILHGKFYTHTGRLLEITPDFWKIDSIKISKSYIEDNAGGAVGIG